MYFIWTCDFFFQKRESGVASNGGMLLEVRTQQGLNFQTELKSAIFISAKLESIRTSSKREAASRAKKRKLREEVVKKRGGIFKFLIPKRS